MNGRLLVGYELRVTGYGLWFTSMVAKLRIRVAGAVFHLADKPPVEIAPLIPMNPALGINETMWYI